MFENSGFWRRFICNLLDFLISLAVIIFIFYFLAPLNVEKLQKISFRFYGSFLLCLVWIALYFIFIPLYFNKQTLFQSIFNLKMINLNNQNISLKTFLIRNLFNGGFWIIVFSTFMILIQVNDFDLNKLPNLKNTFGNQIKQNIVAVLISYWFLLHFITNISIIINKKRLSIIDKITHTRVVINKYKAVIKPQELKLIPYYCELPKFEYFKSDER
ncbi:RDD family protein [Mycoplasmopsis citelli]|uniref:RDD family protein n=1 Tax=Mycoplasmopsis citelli TaxID=171281 RepID=A0A449B0Y9_9BACT|nr:RDD family protein [Mycoplasmopsis citelli]UUD36631.1 RDD family protein [Mycoplasmopsis citelli]VEU74270.1 RDD family protein [Mycoplasmopsis citelli]